MVQQTMQTIRQFAEKSNGRLNEIEHKNAFWIREGSTIVNIHVEPYRDNQAIISIFSFVVRGASINETLLQYLMKLNAKLNFGAFGIFEDGIIFKYDILGGEHVDFQEFKNALLVVALVADQYDDKIIALHGGKTGIDYIQESDLQEISIEEKET